MKKAFEGFDSGDFAKLMKEAQALEPTKSRMSAESGFTILRDESPSPTPTVKQQEEFHLLLRFALDIVGAPPRGYEDDNPKDMDNRAKEDKRHKLKAKRKLVDVIRALKEMADEYPSLNKKYKEELGQLS